MIEVFRAPDLRTLYKAPATGKQGGIKMFWFLFSAIAAILAACVPIMSHMATFGGADDEQL